MLKSDVRRFIVQRDWKQTQCSSSQRHQMN